MKKIRFYKPEIMAAALVLLTAGATLCAAAFLSVPGAVGVMLLMVVLSVLLMRGLYARYMEKLKRTAGSVLVSTAALSTPELLVGELSDALRLKETMDAQELRRNREYMIARFLADHSNEKDILDLQQRAKLLLHSNILGMHGSWFTVLYISVDNANEVYRFPHASSGTPEYTEGLDVIRSKVEAAANAHELGYCAEYDKDLICFINLIDTTEQTPQTVLLEKKQEIAHAAEGAVKQIFEETGLKIRIAVAEPFSDIRELRRVVDDLQTILDYGSLSGNFKTVITFDDISFQPQDADRRDAARMERRFFKALVEHNLKDAGEALDEIFRLESHGSLDALRSLRKKMSLRLRFAADVYGIRAEQAEDLEEALNQLECASSFEKMQKIAVGILGLLEPQSASGDNRSGAEELLQFIQENYADPGLSLMLLSEKFDMSQSCISRAVKNATGERMTDYIHGFRIAEAKRLLIETDMTVYEIGDRVGYNTNWTMTRAFKRYVNMTPGAFREQARQSNGAQAQ